MTHDDESTLNPPLFVTTYQITGKNKYIYNGPFVVPPAFPDDLNSVNNGLLLLSIPNMLPPKPDPSNYPQIPGEVFKFSILDPETDNAFVIISVPIDALLPPNPGTNPSNIPTVFYENLFNAFQGLRLYSANLEKQQLLNRGAGSALATRVASNLLLRYDQWLSFQYMFDPANRWLDLRPGMRLRLLPQSYAYFDLDYKNPDNNAFVGTGSILEVCQSADHNLYLSPYHRAIRPYTVGASPYSNQVAGFLDFGSSIVTKPYLRLIYPATISAANPKTLDAPSPEYQVVLLGAATYSEMQTTTTYFIRNNKMPDGTSSYAHFSGRAAVQPELSMTWQEQPRWMPFGTSLRDLLDRQLVATPEDLLKSTTLGPTPTADPFIKLTLKRWGQPALRINPQRDTRWLYQRCEFDPIESVIPDGWPSDGATVWDLPLQMGDEIEID